MTSELRERLAYAIEHAPLCEHPGADTCQQWTYADAVLAVFAEHLTSDATVERMARAMYCARYEVPVEHLRPDWAETLSGAALVDLARAGLAALAAALVAEGEAS